MRGATDKFYVAHVDDAISIHAPHAGSDGRNGREKRNAANFNPRSPCGERLRNTYKRENLQLISIHAPHAGSDCPGL